MKNTKEIHCFKRTQLTSILLFISLALYSQVNEKASTARLIDSIKRNSAYDKCALLQKIWNEINFEEAWYSSQDVDSRRKILFDKPISKVEFASNKLKLFYIVIASFDTSVNVSNFVKIKEMNKSTIYDKAWNLTSSKNVRIQNNKSNGSLKVYGFLSEIKRLLFEFNFKQLEILIKEIRTEIDFEDFSPETIAL